MYVSSQCRVCGGCADVFESAQSVFIEPSGNNSAAAARCKLLAFV